MSDEYGEKVGGISVVSMQVVFVCTGNTCRSPMAAVVFEDYVRSDRQLSLRDIQVFSAGLHASSGNPAAGAARRAVRQKGLSLEAHRATLFNEEHTRADLILTMTEEHKAELILRYPHAADRVYTLKEFAGETGGSLNVADPFGQDDQVYMETLNEIEAAITRIVQRLAKKRKES